MPASVASGCPAQAAGVACAVELVGLSEYSMSRNTFIPAALSWVAAARSLARLIELPAGAGDPGSISLPATAVTLRNDASMSQYIGAAPPAGHGVHHYQFVVHALDTPHLDVDPGATPAFLMFNLLGHTLARGALTALYEQN